MTKTRTLNYFCGLSYMVFGFFKSSNKHIHLSKGTHRSDDETLQILETKDSQPIELKQTNEAKDYFLPHIFPSHEEEDDDHLDEEDDSIYNYDYDIKDNYKDTATEKSVNDKIPIHTAKDNLPMFLLEPENTYVVKNKPATLKCRAANALEVSTIFITKA